MSIIVYNNSILKGFFLPEINIHAIQFNFIDDDDYIHDLHKALATLIRCDVTSIEQQLKRGDYFSNISRSKQNFDELKRLILNKEKAEPIYIF